MVEIVLSLSLAAGFIGLLVYIYFHEKEERELRDKDLTRIQKLMGESFRDFLKHIEKLEKMTLPKPVTTKEVQKVLDRVGEVTDAGAFENEIETEEDKGVELQSDEWTGLINDETKVAFEGDESPTMVETV